MKKQVTFLEAPTEESVLKHKSGHMLMRSAQWSRCKSDFEHLAGQPVRELCRGTHTSASAGRQQTGAMHISKSVRPAHFLQQYPALTAGQRRYLCSIANIYSTENMRRQMKQHHLSVLQACIQSGQRSTCRRTRGNQQHREKLLLGKDAEARARLHRQKKASGNTDAVVFPKIVDRYDGK